MKLQEIPAISQFEIIMQVLKTSKPELFLKLLGSDQDIYEFHHILWDLPFYRKLYLIKNSFNTLTYIYISDRNTPRNLLFHMYELKYKKLSFPGSFNIEKNIIDIDISREKFKDYFQDIQYLEPEISITDDLINYISII